VTRPLRFEHFRWLGDKDSMRVHDLDNIQDRCQLDDLLARERFASFGPDTLPEAKNRCYKPCPHCVRDENADAEAVA
jgi:hypothetical protein